MKKIALLIVVIALVLTSQQASASQGDKKGVPFQDLWIVLGEKIDLLQNSFLDLAERSNLLRTEVDSEIALMNERIGMLEARLDQCGCGDPAIDLDTDVNNCGAYGNACANGEKCESGMCAKEAVGPACTVSELTSLAICGAGHGPLDYYYISYCVDELSDACYSAYVNLRNCAIENCYSQSGSSIVYECMEHSCPDEYSTVYGLFDNCTDGDERVCGASDVGECAYGVEICENGAWGNCNAVLPTTEMCNGKDDDCDGLIDEDIEGAPASKNYGVCSGSQLVCRGGEWHEPDYYSLPGYEAEETSCDGLDNDCDGLSDEGYDIYKECYIDGRQGETQCSSENTIECVPFNG
jgi:hypothetical protein